ncbi:MAG: ATP-binding protein [Candidatus Dormibacteraeota bacterium]|nr:ATP-binding protein [Candidatus Dormibacteraeota bacterium]
MAPPFVGRRQDLTVLASKLRDVRSGQPEVVLIDGPAGIGKTALVDRFLGQLRDTQVLRASGEESEGLLAYGVIRPYGHRPCPAGGCP